MSSRRATLAFSGLAVCVGLIPVVWLLAFHVPYVRWLDTATLHGFTDLGHPRVKAIANPIAHLADPSTFVLLGCALLAVAIARGRLRVALAVPLILTGANVTTQILKPMLATARFSEWSGAYQVRPASWPSGHATASMSLALCAILVAPARLRPAIAAIGAAFSIAVCFSFLTLGWHYPSDVIGGYLVATTWTLLAVGLLFAAQERWPDRSARASVIRVRDTVAPMGISVAGALTLAAIVLLARPTAVMDYAREHTAFVAGAAGIGAIGVAIATGFALALRRGGGTPASPAQPERGSPSP